MAGPANVIELIEKLEYRDAFLMSLIEFFRDESLEDKHPWRVSKRISGSTPEKVYRELEKLVSWGALEVITIGNYGVTVAGIAALRATDPYFVPSLLENERRDQRKIYVPGRD